VSLSTLRLIVVTAGVLSIAADASGQDPPRERFSLGIAATPALEGGGPWFMPAARVSGPVAGRIGFDIDAGPLYGGSHEFATIRSHYVGRIRVGRGQRSAEGNGRYWTAGIQYFPATKTDQAGTRERRHYTALAIGMGWDYVSRNRLRAVNEIGFSGGDGFMVYGSFGVGWSLRRAKSAD
jgi:hypothetical protein